MTVHLFLCRLRIIKPHIDTTYRFYDYLCSSFLYERIY